MSANSGSAPRWSTGPAAATQCTPSVLWAKCKADVVHDPGTLTLYVAQNSRRLGIHSTSICQAKAFVSAKSVGTALDQLIPSLDRRRSTVVAPPLQPSGPLFTAHINQSPGPRRTTLGEMML